MKILLVEDEIEIANFLIRGLKYEGYKIDHVTTGEEGVSAIFKKSYDIVILDIVLPSMSGEEVLKKIRRQKKSIPIIILTAVGNVGTKTKLLNAGADDYLVKPFSFVELIARIKSILRRSKGHTQQLEELIVGDLKLVPNMRMVTRKDKPIKLRLKEYALLEYLMRNPDKVISRNTLIENVWDYNAHLFSNTVDSHISLLRRKINKGFKEELIETIHGIGYILRTKAI